MSAINYLRGPQTQNALISSNAQLLFTSIPYELLNDTREISSLTLNTAFLPVTINVLLIEHIYKEKPEILHFNRLKINTGLINWLEQACVPSWGSTDITVLCCVRMFDQYLLTIMGPPVLPSPWHCCFLFFKKKKKTLIQVNKHNSLNVKQMQSYDF